MSFPTYAHYKDSGVEWLGEVPAHWAVRPLKRLARLVTGMTPPTDDYDNYEDAGFPWVRPEDINETGNAISASKFLSQKGAALSRHVGNGAILICCIGTIGKVGFTSESVATNQQITAAEFIGYGKYFYYFARAARNEMELAATGNVLKILNSERLGNIKFVHPPEAEQASIAAFLDHETTKLDALITEQRTLIDLLKEKRQAVISHAVTKGLDSRVAMKDSGVEWLGEVPAHWDALSVRRISTAVQTGGTPASETPSSDLDEGIFWYTPGDFDDGIVLSTSSRKASQSSYDLGELKIFPADSVLIVSIGATLGKVGFLRSPASANQQINAIIPNHRVNGYFLAYSLLVRVEVMRFLSNASTIGIMNQEKTKEIYVAVPPISEQRQITEYLDRETDRLDALTAEAQTTIALLQERRSALISAAVTGKIDVRQAA